MIKDLPATMPHDIFMAFLLGFPHIKTKSKVIFAKECIGGEEVSPFINRDVSPSSEGKCYWWSPPVEYGTNLSKIMVISVPPIVITPVTLECVGHMTLTVGLLPLGPTTTHYQTIIGAPLPLVNGSSVVQNMPTNGKNVNMLNALTSHNVCMRQNTQLRKNISLWPLKQMRTPQNGITSRSGSWNIYFTRNGTIASGFRQTLMTVAEATQDIWGGGGV